MRAAVIGGGAFGAMSAIRLAEDGHAVTVFERLPALGAGTSGHANRIHMGFHYPRHRETALQCLRGAARFREEFSEAILGGVFNAYFVAAEESLTSGRDFLAFCDGLGLPYRQIDPVQFEPRIDNVEVGIVTEELIYDPRILQRLMLARLDRAGADIRVGSDVTGVARQGDNGFVVTTGKGALSFDAVVNCAYANVNRIATFLGHAPHAAEYEYVATPVIRFPDFDRSSVTVMDGPFCCLLPFGRDGDHLLYDVERSVVARGNGTLIDPTWLDPDTSPFAGIDKERFFEEVRDSCARFIPAVRQARLTGFVQAPRMVLADVTDTDARPSIVSRREPGFVEVFSGKVDHCVWVGDEVAGLLCDDVANAPGAV